MLEGVKHLHEHDILHSDIKPANILVDERGDVKLTDLGWQFIYDSVSTHTHSDFFRGTIYYCSPEVLNGKPRSHENDCWSVGATLVHMITGKPLNHKAPGYQAMNEIRNYNLEYNGACTETAIKNNHMELWVKHILSKTLCKPADRATASELLEYCRSVKLNSDLAHLSIENK